MSTKLTELWPEVYDKTSIGSDRFLSPGPSFLKLENAVKTRDYYFVLLPKMTMLAFSSAVEPLRVANQLTGQCLYRWYVISEDGKSVVCSNGISIAVDFALLPVERQDTIIVCSGHDGYSAAGSKTLGMLRLHHRRGGQVGGICTGAYTLARAGLLEDKRFTLHWGNQPAFEERFSNLEVSAQIYETDAGIITCGGGTAVTDMMLAIIEEDYGRKLSHLVMDMCVHGKKRNADTRQKASIATTINSRNGRLIRIVHRMQENIAEPLSFDELTYLEGISKRQMERLFKRYLGVGPSQHYISIRLDYGRSLVFETDMSVMEISVACGFSSSSHFSKSYKKRFGVCPSANM